MIKSYFAEIEKNYELEFIDEEIPLGTGGGLKLIEGRINNTFILTNCDILVLDKDNRRVLPGSNENGELCVRGSFLGLGYYNNPEKTAAVFIFLILHNI